MSPPTKHVIRVTLSDAAQRASIIRGEPSARTQDYEVPQPDLAALMALPWTEVSREGAASCCVPRAADTRPASASEAIAWGARCAEVEAASVAESAAREEALGVERAAQAAEREAALAAERLENDAIASAWLESVEQYCAGGPQHPGTLPWSARDALTYEVKFAANRRVQDENDRRVAAAVTARQQRLVALYRATAQGADDPRLEVATHERPLGAVPENEALDRVKQQLADEDEAAGRARYVRLDARNAPECKFYDYDDCYDVESARGPNPRYSSEVEVEATPRSRGQHVAITATLAALEAAGLERGQIVLHRAVCGCEHSDCMRSTDRYSVRVERDLGEGLTVRCDYAVPCADEQSD